MTPKTAAKNLSESGKVHLPNGGTKQEKNKAENQKFKVGDFVSIKIDHLDKKNRPFIQISF